MATDTWNGATGAWEVAGNWSAGVPTSTSDVVITAGKPSITNTTPAVTINTLNNAANLTIADAPPVNVTGDVTLTGSLHIDDKNNEGGSTMTIGGTLNVTATGVAGTAAGSVNMGSNKELATGTTITAAALNDVNPVGGTPGTLNIVGNATGPGLSEIHITGAVGFGGGAGVLIGLVNLAGDSLLEFNTGLVISIAAGSSLILAGADAFVADASNASSNSALNGLATIAGTFQLLGTPLTLPGAITNTGFLEVDDSAPDGGPGGSIVTINNTLTNSNLLDIGVNNLALATTVTLDGLDNSATGTVNVTGNVTPPAVAALLTINGPALTAGTVAVNTAGEINVVSNPYQQTGGTTTVSGTLAAAADLVISAGILTQAPGGVIDGDVFILAAGTGLGLVINNGTVDTTSGLTSGTTINSGGTELVEGGANDIGTAVSNGGLQIVYGLATGATVSSGGYQFVGSSGGPGGVASATTVDGGAYTDVGAGGTFVGLIDSGGTDFVAGTASNTTIDSGSMEQVSPGGLTVSATISGGGVLELLGSASGTMVDSAGYQLVLSGGSASGTILNDGFTFAAPGAVLRNTLDSAGGADELGGTTVGTVIDANSFELTLSGGTSISATINSGGNETDYGVVSGATVSSGGYEFIGSGGTAIGTTVSSAGYLFVDSVGTAIATQLLSGYAFAAAGAVLSDTMDSGGGDDVAGTAIGTVNSNGASELVLAGGTTLDATVSAGGVEDIGGSGSGVTVLDAGYELVTSGGSVTGSVLAAGAFAFAAAGATLVGSLDSGGTDDAVGTASGTVVSSGGAEVVSGTAIGAIISLGGQQQVSGAASATTVAGGYELVDAGGSAAALTIADNGNAAIDPGGTINGATISGGTLDILSGANIGSTPIGFASGGGGTLLVLNDSIHFAGLVAGFSGTAEMDLVDIPYIAGTTTFTWSQTVAGSNGSGTLTVNESGTIANIALLGQYSQTSFALQSGSFGGTLVTDPPPSGGTVTDPNPPALAVTRHA